MMSSFARSEVARVGESRSRMGRHRGAREQRRDARIAGAQPRGPLAGAPLRAAVSGAGIRHRFTRLALPALLALAAGAFAPSPARALSVPASHPRILIYADSLAALRNRITSMPQLGTLYNAWYSYFDSRRDHPNYNNGWTDDMAALYAISGETKFSDVAIREAMKNVRAGGENQQGYARLSVPALTYDWCYPVIPVAQRDSMKAYCLNLLQTMDNQNPPYDVKDRRWQYALAIFGEAGAQNAFVQQKLLEYISLEETYALPCMDEIAGGGSCGYYPGVFYSNQVVYIDCLRHAMGYPSFAANSQWWTSSPVAWMFRMRPDWKWARTTGRYNTAEAYQLPFLSFWGSRLQNRYAQYLANVLSTESQDGSTLLPVVLWFIPTAPASSPAGLGLTYADTDYGYYFWRSDWNLGPNSNDLHVSFFNGPDLEPDHEKTQNSFTVTRGSDDLLMSAGQFYDNSDQHYQHYAARAVSRNTVLIYDPGESFGTGVPNDGGQCQSDFTVGHIYWPACGDLVGYRGRAEVLPPDPALAFGVRGWASKAYSPAKARKVCRELRVPAGRNWILLQDHIELEQPALEVRLVFHCIEKPEVDGTAELMEGSSYGGIWRYRDASMITITRGDSRCRIYPCFAARGEKEIRVVGGASPANLVWRQNVRPSATLTYVSSAADQAYECWVAGANRSPTHGNLSQNHINNRNNEPQACGDWRVEVLVGRGPEGGDGLDMITAIEIGSTMIPTRLVTTADVGDGTQVLVAGGGEEFLFHLPSLECAE